MGMKPGPQTRLPSTEHLCWDHLPMQHPAGKSNRVFAHQRETETAGNKTIFFPFISFFFPKDPMHRICVHSHSPWAWVKGGQCSLQSNKESLESEAGRRVMGEWLLGSWC